MKSNKINVNGESLSYYDSEKGNTTLLFIHGAFINKEYWNDQLSHFAPKYRIVAVDLAGHGDSSQNRNDWTAQSFGKDISEIIKKISLKNIIIIGHSIGSDIMLETVINNPSQIKGLVEVDHMKNVGVEVPQEDRDEFIQNLRTDFVLTCEQYANQVLLTEDTNPILVTKLLQDYRKMSPDVGIPLLKNDSGYKKREAALLKGLEQKLFLLHVNYMPTNEDNLKKYLGNNYELQTLNGTCHYPMLENPEKFNAALENILLKIEKS